MIKAYSSTIIDLPADKVWDRVKNFNGLPEWHPAATDSKIEEGYANGEVGCVRNFALTDGRGRIRETLLSISNPEQTLVYDMLLGGPLPFINYVAKMKFSRITDRNQTFAEWWADFDVSDEQEEHWKSFVVSDVFIGGFRALEDSFK